MPSGPSPQLTLQTKQVQQWVDSPTSTPSKRKSKSKLSSSGSDSFPSVLSNAEAKEREAFGKAATLVASSVFAQTTAPTSGDRDSKNSKGSDSDQGALSLTTFPRVPVDFGEAFANLKALYLDHNNLTDSSFPSDFGTQFPFLEKLHLEHNQFEKFPLCLCGEYDSMRFRIARDSGGKCVGHDLDAARKKDGANLKTSKHSTSAQSFLPSLKKLYLNNNRLTSIAEGIGNLSNLQVLDVHANEIRKLPPQLALIEPLEQLICHENPIISPPPFISQKGTSYMVHRYLREVCDSYHTPVPYDSYLYKRKILIKDGDDDSDYSGKLGKRDSTNAVKRSSLNLSKRDSIGVSKNLSKMSMTKAEASKVAAQLQAKALKSSDSHSIESGRHVTKSHSDDSGFSLDSDHLLYFLVEAGFSAEKGYREYMEDRCIGFPRLRQPRTTTVQEEVVGLFSKIGYFGVYDGHGGYRCAEYLTDNLHKLVCNSQAFRDGDFRQALIDGFAAADEAFLGLCRTHSLLDGSTAVVVMVVDNQLFIAHAGDSRAVLVRDRKAVRLTEDHKPERPDELQRIEDSGGEVVYRANCFRVAGDLAMSRSIGDLRLKEPRNLVISQPDIRVERLTPRDSSIILATDGVWDVISDQKAADIVRKQPSAQEAAQKLTQASLTMGTADNTSAIVINLLWSLDEISGEALNGEVEVDASSESDKKDPEKGERPRKKRSAKLKEPATGPMTAEERNEIIQDTLRKHRMKGEKTARSEMFGDVSSELSDSPVGHKRTGSSIDMADFKEGIFKKVIDPKTAVMLRVTIPKLDAAKLLQFDLHMLIEDILEMLILKMRFEGSKEDWGLFRTIKEDSDHGKKGDLEKTPLKWARTLKSYNFAATNEVVELRELTGHEREGDLEESVLVPENMRKKKRSGGNSTSHRHDRHGKKSGRRGADSDKKATRSKSSKDKSSERKPASSPSASASKERKRRDRPRKDDSDAAASKADEPTPQPSSTNSSTSQKTTRRRRREEKPARSFEPMGDWEVFSNIGDCMVSIFGTISDWKDENELSTRNGNEKIAQVVLARQRQQLCSADPDDDVSCAADTWLCRLVAKSKLFGGASPDSVEVLVNGFLTAHTKVNPVKLRGVDDMTRVLVDLLCDTGSGTTMVQFGIDIPNEHPTLKKLLAGLAEMVESAKDARAHIQGSKRGESRIVGAQDVATKRHEAKMAEAARRRKNDLAAAASVPVPASIASPSVSLKAPPPLAAISNSAAAGDDSPSRTHHAPYANLSAVVAAEKDALTETVRTHESPYANASAVAAAIAAAESSNQNDSDGSSNSDSSFDSSDVSSESSSSSD